MSTPNLIIVNFLKCMHPQFDTFGRESFSVMNPTKAYLPLCYISLHNDTAIIWELVMLINAFLQVEFFLFKLILA